MTWKQARIIALQHIARLNVPRGLDGVTIVITDYDDEDLLRFIKVEEPDITLESQRMINQAFAREMRKRGARIERVLVNVNDYFSWLGKFDLTDSPAMRAQYISWLTCPEPKFTPHQI
jgi:hypothetical protein